MAACTTTAFSTIPRSSSVIAMPRGQPLPSRISHVTFSLGSSLVSQSSARSAAACISLKPSLKPSLNPSSVIPMPRGQLLPSRVSHVSSSLLGSSLVTWCSSSSSAAAACRSLNPNLNPSWNPGLNPDDRRVLRRRKSRVEGFVCRAAIYSVTLKTPQGEVLMNVSDDMFILDAAEENGIKLPYSCRSGACSSCAAVLKEGKIDQSDQSYLEEAQVKEGELRVRGTKDQWEGLVHPKTLVAVHKLWQKTWTDFLENSRMKSSVGLLSPSFNRMRVECFSPFSVLPAPHLSSGIQSRRRS